MEENKIATTQDLVLRLRDRGFPMYTEEQMEQFGLTTTNCWVPPSNKCLCTSDILGIYEEANRNFYDQYLDSIWGDERQYYLRPTEFHMWETALEYYPGNYKIGNSVFMVPESYKNNQLVSYDNIDLIIEVKIKHSRIVDDINTPRDVFMCTKTPTVQEADQLESNLGIWNRIVLHWVGDESYQDTGGYYSTNYILSQGLCIGVPGSNTLSSPLTDLTNQQINCYWVDGDSRTDYEVKPAFTANVYVGGYFVNNTV